MTPHLPLDILDALRAYIRLLEDGYAPEELWDMRGIAGIEPGMVGDDEPDPPTVLVPGEGWCWV